jgi:hypothetical protein
MLGPYATSVGTFERRISGRSAGQMANLGSPEPPFTDRLGNRLGGETEAVISF